MANQKKIWFLAPNWNTPPSAIQLGNVITDRTSPERPLISVSTLSVESQNAPDSSKKPQPFSSPSASTAPVAHAASNTAFNPVLDTEVYSNIASNYTLTLSNDNINTFAHFLKRTVKLDFSMRKEEAQSYSFKTQETQWFVPPASFATRVMADGRARQYLTAMGNSTPLYIISGVQTVWSAKASTTVKQKRGFGGKPGEIAMAAGVPELKHEAGEERKMGWECEGPITFAYRLERIQKTKRGIESKEEVKGAFFGAGKKRVEEPIEIEFGNDELDADADVSEALPSFDEATNEECMVVVFSPEEA